MSPGKHSSFHFARHHFENAALHLHALRLAERVHRHFHAHAHVHGDAQQIHVQQLAAHRIHLPILHHGAFFGAAVELAR